MEEALVFLDRHGRYVTATTTALQMLRVADQDLASFRVAHGQDSRRQELADWGVLAERGPGVGESLLVSPGGERYEVTVLVTHIPTGWQLTIEALDPPAREPGVMRGSPEALAAWRGALPGEADEAVDAAPGGTVAVGADQPNPATAET